MGFGRACSPVRCAHPSFWLHLHAKRGAARPPPPFAAPLLLIRPPKIFTIYRTWAAHVKSFHWTTEAMKYEVPCPRPVHRSFSDPSGNIEVKLCTNATIRLKFFGFFSFFHIFWIFPFCQFLPFLLSFSISSYSSLLILLFLSLLILLVGAILRLLILLFHLGLKFMYIPVRPDVLTFLVFFFCINIMSPAPPNRSCADLYGVINDIRR